MLESDMYSSIPLSFIFKTYIKTQLWILHASPQKKCISASDFMSSQMLRSPSVDTRVHWLQVKNLRLRDVGELVTLKGCFCVPAQRSP